MDCCEVKTWKLRAAEQQQSFYSLFGNRIWDQLNKDLVNFEDLLRLKISFALFARLPGDLADGDVRLQQRVDIVTEEILHLSGTVGDSIYIGYTYICTYDQTGAGDGIVPLLRVKTDNDRVYFVESRGTTVRVYEGWKDFMENNSLGNYLICYPKKGIYRSTVEGRVSVAYSGTSYEPGGIEVETISTKPLEIHLFFPFAETSLTKDTKINMKHETTYVLLNKSLTRRWNFVDHDCLAVWLKVIAAEWGKILKDDSNMIFLSFENGRAKKAVDIFRLFYNSAYNVRCSFAGVTLMKGLLSIRVGNPPSRRVLEDFAAVLKFVANVSPSSVDQVGEIIGRLHDNDCYWRNILDISSNCDFRPFAEMVFCDNDNVVSRTLDIIAKPTHDDNHLTNVVKQLISELTDSIEKGKTKAHQLGSRASDVIGCSLKFKLYQAYVRDIKRSRAELREKLKGVVKINTSEYTLDVLNIILGCVKKVTSSLTPNCSEIVKIYEQQFLKFVFHFVDCVGKYVEIDDVFLYITDKFITKHQAFLIGQSEAPTGNGIEGVLFAFIESMNDAVTIKELSDDFLLIQELTAKKIVSAPILIHKGMCVKIKQFQDIDFLSFGVLCEDTWIHSFGYDYTNYIRSEDIHNDHHVLLSSLNGKFVLNFLSFNIGGHHGANRAENIAFNITFTIPPN